MMNNEGKEWLAHGKECANCDRHLSKIIESKRTRNKNILNIHSVIHISDS